MNETTSTASDPGVEHIVFCDCYLSERAFADFPVASSATKTFTGPIELARGWNGKEAAFPEGSLGMEYLDVWQESFYPLPVNKIRSICTTAVRLEPQSSRFFAQCSCYHLPVRANCLNAT